MSKVFTILCLASYDKGSEFMREAKRQGCRVLLLTAPRTNNADWPRDHIDEIFVLRDIDGKWDDTELVNSVSYVARKEKIDAIVALDDYDLEAAGLLRDHLQIRGFGETVTRNFRDKLAMRRRAWDEGVLAPDYVHLVNEAAVKAFTERVPVPYIVKPRGEASAIGVKKISSHEELWKIYEELGDRRAQHLVEQFLPGDIFHVDSLMFDGKIGFACVSKYGKPPFDVMHGGGIFTTRNVEQGSQDEKDALKANEQVLQSMGLRFGASHTEFIKAHSDGKMYFMETAARVGGANIVEMVDAATGVNLWAEWAKIEINYGTQPYQAPEAKKDYAGIIISLSKQEWPDMSSYNDPEICWRMNKAQHAGLIVRSASYERITELLDNYQQRFYNDFYMSLPAPDKATA
ncbi:MAG: ATP-grasp domain-containing protein [Candidatus Kapaibacterium sp.]|nr:MAG: ATP-grasp domain-containing protein [Candidatus Kapabacteria bacterium]